MTCGRVPRAGGPARPRPGPPPAPRTTDSGNGHYGGLQFDAQTWRANGGTECAPLPRQASREEQIAVAQNVRDSRGGHGAWPACARELGLPGSGA